MIFFVCVLSRVWSFATLWTVVCQAPLSMGFSRQEYWSGLPFPTPRDLPILGSNPHLLQILNWQAGSLPLSHEHSRAAPSPWGWWPGCAARLLCGLLCCPVQRGHGTALPSHMWHQWCGSHPGGGQPGCRPRGLPQEEAPAKGLAWALTLRQVFVSTESIVNPGVSLPCSVRCCFLIFINASFYLTLRLIPVQFHVEDF